MEVRRSNLLIRLHSVLKSETIKSKGLRDLLEDCEKIVKEDLDRFEEILSRRDL